MPAKEEEERKGRGQAKWGKGEKKSLRDEEKKGRQ